MITVVVLAVVAGVLLLAWRKAGAARSLAWMMAAAFILRMGVSLLLSWALPIYGYNGNQAHQMGYYYIDGQRRDSAAIALARSDQPLLSVFEQEIASDQYGGLLMVSAWIYRYLSPDAWRPELISIVTAGVAALGIAAAWSMLRRRFGPQTANLAGWILALYPESVLLGGAPMREPYLITGIAVLLWAGDAWQREPFRRRLTAGLVFLLASAAMVLVSSRAALPLIGIVLVGLLWDMTQSQGVFYPPFPSGKGAGGLGRAPAGKSASLPKAAAWAALAAALVLGLVVSWGWLRESAVWDTQLTIQQSGWVQAILERIPEQGAVPFVIGYGLAQPVLPAAISDLLQPLLYVPQAGEAPLQAAPLVLRGTNLLLSLSWYALLTLLVYGFFRIWRTEDPSNRRLLIVCAAAVLAWLVISSARAGGDQWDNPRYRSMALVWMAAVAAWAGRFAASHGDAASHRDPWLLRMVLVVGIFVFFFTEWYISRYTRLIGRLDFFVMIGLIAGLSGFVVVGGWAWDRMRRKRQPSGEAARVTLTHPPDPL